MSNINAVPDSPRHQDDGHLDAPNTIEDWEEELETAPDVLAPDPAERNDPPDRHPHG